MLNLREFSNLSQHLNLYSKVYPRYFPVDWRGHKQGEGFLLFQATVDRMFYNMPFFIGIPQAVLNFVVFFTVILITKHPFLAIKSAKSVPILPRFHRAAFIFIGNMALADFLLVIVELTVVQIELRTKSRESQILATTTTGAQPVNDFLNAEEIVKLDQLRMKACRAQVVLWVYAVATSFLASVIITLDRFVYIMYGIKYLAIVTPVFIKTAILTTWLFPMVMCYFAFAQFEQKDDPECFMGHLEPKSHIIFVMSAIVTIIFFTYGAYGKICIKAATSKRKREQTLQNRPVTLKRGPARVDSRKNRLCSNCRNISNCSSGAANPPSAKASISTTNIGSIYDHPTSSPVASSEVALEVSPQKNVRSQFRWRSYSSVVVISNANNGSGSSSAANGTNTPNKNGRAGKYVLILLLVLTISWLPLIVLFIHDFTVHNSEDIIKALTKYNCYEKNDEEEVPMLSLQECLFFAATHSSNSSCFFLQAPKSKPLSQARICQLVLQTFHGKMQDLWQKIALIIGMINSILNPIIYAFWYSQFRLRIVQTWRNFFARLALPCKKSGQ